MPPRSRRGGARLLCGLYHRHVGHSAFRVHPCTWQVHGIFVAFFFQAGVLQVRRDFVFLCRTTIRTSPFVSHSVSLDVQQYSRVQQKSLSINNKDVGCRSNFNPSGPLYTQDTSFSVKSSLTAVCHGVQTLSTDIFDQQPTIPPCVYNNSTYSSTSAERKSENAETGRFN